MNRNGISVEHGFYVLSTILILVFILSGPLSVSAFESDGLQTASDQISFVSTNLPLGNYLLMTTAISNNLTVLSVSGGEYSLSEYIANGQDIMRFTPSNGSLFILVVNVSAYSFTSRPFVFISKQMNDSVLPVENLTGMGGMVVKLVIHTLPPRAQYAAWNPIFGILPFRFQIGSITFAQSIALFTAIGCLIMLLGIILHSKLVYLGLFVLSGAFFIVAGIMVLLIAIGLYFLGFVAINLIWRIRTHTRNRTDSNC